MHYEGLKRVRGEPAAHFRGRSEGIQTNQPSVKDVFRQITPSYTIDGFKAICKLNPEYNFIYCNGQGTNIFHVAAAKGNYKLILHLLDKGMGEIYPSLDELSKLHRREIRLEDLVNYSDNGFRTPLYLCVQKCKDARMAYLTAKTLIDFGANVKLSGISCGIYCKVKSPLWIAAEKTKNLPLIQLLILHGGIVHWPLTKNGKKNIKMACHLLHIQVQKRALLSQLQEHVFLSYLGLPKSLITQIMCVYKVLFLAMPF